MKILVLGDSHAHAFKKVDIEGVDFDIVLIVGATVSGLDNPNSKTQAIWAFMDAVEKTDADVIVTLLGEVDTGFVIWYRATKYNANVSEMLALALANYQKFLSDLASKAKVFCMSVPLPTREKSTGSRGSIKASQAERTELTLRFNREMRRYCEENGIGFIGFDYESLNENGLVKDGLLKEKSTDHHYDINAYAEMITPRLCAELRVAA